MRHYIGLDVSMKQTSICIVNDEGKIVYEKEVETDPKAIFESISEANVAIQLVGLESGSLSHWLVDGLKKLGLPTICICSRKMAAILSVTINKTDKNDARGIASALRGGHFREVHHKSQYAVELSTLMGSRRSLVNQRTEGMNTIRGLLKTYGILVGVVKTEKFSDKVEGLLLELSKDAQVGLRALLEVFRVTHSQIMLLEEKIAMITMDDPVIKLLTSIPGIGPVTALTYKMDIDDPKRFKKSRSVGAYIGLTPLQYSSGETNRQGRISKCGPSELRYLLGEAAANMMLLTKGWNQDKAWAFKIMKKHGFQKARMALARKLAVKMHRMWVNGTEYEWVKVKPEEEKMLEKAKQDRKKAKKVKKKIVEAKKQTA